MPKRSKMPRYETFFFRDLTVAITPQQILDLAMTKFREFGLTASRLREGHTPACIDCPMPQPYGDSKQRYYAIQVEAPFFLNVLPAIGQFQFLGFGPAYPEALQTGAGGENPAPR